MTLINPSQLLLPIQKIAKSDKVQHLSEEIKAEYIEELHKAIKSNEDHISNVADFLLNDCQNVEISEELKLKIFDQSTGNKAPFHNKKNNVADAAILFSAAEYLKKIDYWDLDDSAIFVSNNIVDFTDGKNDKVFHPDILAQLQGTSIQYERVLPGALKLSNKIILDIEEYHKQEAWLENNYFNCQTHYCTIGGGELGYGHLEYEIAVKSLRESFVDPRQMLLFDLPILPSKLKAIRIGKCYICGTTHFDCPICGEITCVEDKSLKFECTECAAKLEIRYDPETKLECLFIDDIEDEDSAEDSEE